MLKSILLFTLLFQNAAISIASPQAGSVIRGRVEILGNMDVPNFASAELDFGYAASDPADAWFVIQTFSQPNADSALAVWDTTSITDGDYNLRLRVFFQDGSFQEVTVTGLQVRNDAPEPTETPIEILQPTSAPLVVANLPPVAPTVNSSFPQPTPLPANPASLTVPGVYSTFGRGALVALGLFVAFSFLLRLRKN